MHKIAKEIKDTLDCIVKERVQDKRVLSMLSGGVDSFVLTYLANKYSFQTVAVTAHDNSIGKDLEHAIKCADYLKVVHQTISLDAVKAFEDTDIVLDICKCLTIVRLQCAIVAYECIKYAKENKFDAVICGDASDALFGSTGHMRRKSKQENFVQIKKDTLIKGAEEGVGKDFLTLCNYFDIEAIVPFRDERMFKFTELEDNLVNKPKEKQILRDAFSDVLDVDLLSRERLTLQVGVGIKDKHIELLRKKSRSAYISPTYLVRERLEELKNKNSTNKLWSRSEKI